MRLTNNKSRWTISTIQFILVIWMVVLNEEASSLKSMVIKVPHSIKSGDTVTLTCEYDLENVALYSVRWYWNNEEFYRFIPKESPPYKTFPVKLLNVDISKSGENTVTLRNVNRHLTGNYKCEVSADLPYFHTSILVAHMTVAELPHDDPIITSSDNKIGIGKNIHVECFSAGSDPQANITWYINNKEVKESSDSVTIHPTRIDLEETLHLISCISQMDVLTKKANFVQGMMRIKCQATIYNLWQKSVEERIFLDSANKRQAVGAMSSHSQMDPIVFGFGSSSSQASYLSKQNDLCILLLIVMFIWCGFSKFLCQFLLA